LTRTSKASKAQTRVRRWCNELLTYREKVTLEIRELHVEFKDWKYTIMPNKNMPNKRTNGSGRFSKGASGNPSGRPLGSRNHATVLMESLLEGKAQELIEKTIELAMGGDITALKILLDRMPPRKDRPIQLSLPPVETVQQISLAVGRVATAVGDGEITPTEGEVLANILVSQKEILATADLEKHVEGMQQRLDDFERRIPAAGSEIG
jgi:hypothetical protein